MLYLFLIIKSAFSFRYQDQDWEEKGITLHKIKWNRALLLGASYKHHPIVLNVVISPSKVLAFWKNITDVVVTDVDLKIGLTIFNDPDDKDEQRQNCGKCQVIWTGLKDIFSNGLSPLNYERNRKSNYHGRVCKRGLQITWSHNKSQIHTQRA